MKKLLKKVFAVSALLGLVFINTTTQARQYPRKIIVFDETIVNEAAQIRLAQRFGAVIIKGLPSINGLSVYLPPAAERALSARPGVLRIDKDLIIKATGKPQPPQQPVEETPWGINRINAGLAWPVTKGLAVKVAVLDTGIDLDHSDLLNNVKGNVNIISPRRSGNDDNGHGTHVAGTIAAADNEIGVIGAGPEIYLYAVKVLDKTGSGWLSDLINGLDWCVSQKMQVVNMSLGSASDNQSFHDAVIKAYQAGLVLVAAAGNNGGAVDYPAKYAETIAVSAIGQDNKLAYFSNFGEQVDLAAPGVNIKSCYNDGYYKILSGTSMATPHVAGTAALVLSTPVGVYDINADGIWNPSEVLYKLQMTAEDLGLSSVAQGAGLVRVDLAIQ